MPAKPFCILATLALLVSACGQKPSEVGVSRTRPYSALEPTHDLAMPTPERLGMREKAPAHDHGSQAQTQGGGTPKLAFTSEAPGTWKEQAPTQMRLINYAFGPNNEGQIYMTILPGSGGGLLANINRWRKQMGLGDWDASHVVKAPRVKIFNADAVKIDIQGTFTGMGDANVKDARMIGAVLSDKQFTIFIKMVGPKAVIDAEAAQFDPFCGSIKFKQSGGNSTADSAKSQPSSDEKNASQPKQASGSQHGMTWERPTNWDVSPRTSSMRLVTFKPKDDSSTECYLVALGGQGGGVLGNINRWRKQMGQLEITKADMAQLPPINVLGHTTPLIDINGSYTGMQGESVKEAKMLAVIAPIGKRTLFVKMIGPKASVEKEREAFKAFVTSIKLK